MDVQALKVFKAVAMDGSISKAAQTLNYVQSNVTARIQQLEEELSTQLFYRHSRGMTLTSAGKTLLSYTDRILYLFEETVKAVQDSPVPRGTLSLGVEEMTATLRIPTVLSNYYKKYPDVDFHLISGRTKDLLQEVLQYNVDAAFVDGPIDHPEIVQEHIVHEQLMLVLNPSIVPYESLKDIHCKTLVMQNPDCTYSARMMQWLQEEGYNDIKIMAVGTLEGIIECVNAGMGVSLLPRTYLQTIPSNSSLQFYPIPDKYGKLSTVFIRRHDFYMTSAMNTFLEEMKQK